MKTLENRNNYGATLAEALGHLMQLRPFHTGTFSGGWENTGGAYEYVVKSYGVTIAVWQSNDGYGGTGEIFSNAYDYSVTTSKHANIVKKAWDL